MSDIEPGSFTVSGNITNYHVDESSIEKLMEYCRNDVNLTLSFANEPTFIDRVYGLSARFEDTYEWCKDPQSWPIGWRWLVAATFPIAIVIWCMTLALLLAIVVALDLFALVVQWGRYWFATLFRRAGPSYVIDFETNSFSMDHPNDVRVVSFRKAD